MRHAFLALACALAAAAPALAAPPVGLDHLVIYSSEDAPEQAALKDAGFTIASTVNHHDGQGTSSVTVEFVNGYIELLYVDPAVSVSPGMETVVQRFKGRMNWRTTGASPFIVQVHHGATAPAGFPFPTFKVHSAWMAPDENVEILTPRDAPNAVTLSVTPDAVDETANAARAADPLKGADFHHANGAQRITGVKVIAPDTAALPAAATQYLSDAGAAEFAVGPQWQMIVTLDNGRQGKTRDFAPTLPLIVHY